MVQAEHFMRYRAASRATENRAPAVQEMAGRRKAARLPRQMEGGQKRAPTAQQTVALRLPHCEWRAHVRRTVKREEHMKITENKGRKRQ